MGHKILLAILCGLPASGKSCLAKSIKEKYDHIASESRTVCCVVCYDQLLPRSLEKQLIASDVTKVACASAESKWKEYREHITGAVETVICEILQKDRRNVHDCDSVTKQTIVDKLKEQMGFALSDGFIENDRFLFIVDDNMYFKSMRHGYYVVARKYNVGFCQIHVQCGVYVAIERNNSRSTTERVDDAVIHSMNTKFEVPDPLHHRWETMSISTDGDHFLLFWPKLERLLQEAFDNPVDVDDGDYDDAQKVASRETCLRSVLHQVDKILRKLVSNEMKKGGRKKPEAEILNGARQTLMQDVKTGKLHLSADVMHRIECGRIEEVEPFLHRFFDEAFHCKLANEAT